MARHTPLLCHLLGRLRALREESGLSAADIEEKLILGPGWVRRFETAACVPSLDVLLAILQVLKKDVKDLLTNLPEQRGMPQFERAVYAEQAGANLLIRFRYADFDATYRLPDARIEEFNQVVQLLRSGLSRLVTTDEADKEAIKTDAVASAFLKAVRIWPAANPSDLWWFLIYRCYCDPFNHPADYSRLDFTQSWKRTSGWALEEVLVRHYGPFLERQGVRLWIAPAEEKTRLLRSVKSLERLEADKADVLAMGRSGREERLFGVIHVKASFAERRTDDVPLSRALMRAGYTSPLWTMDCKSTPSETPANQGELGKPFAGEVDARSAKRKDIEQDQYFSACFSYNANTAPTPRKVDAKARIFVCDFRDPDDTFSRFILREWQKFRSAKKR